MNIELYTEIKKAIKDGLSEWYSENIKNINVANNISENEEKLFTIKKFTESYPFISENGLRHRIFCGEYNKFNKCFSRVGRRILIKEKETLDYFSNPPPEANWTYDKNKHKSR